MTIAAAFHALHVGPDVLLLPNGWDPMSCRLLEEAGAKAVATSSAAVAWSLGYPDGDVLGPDLLVRTVSEITRVLSVPLSADIEGGYSADPGTVGQIAARVIQAGAVGINIEDGGGDPALLAAKIEAAREAAVTEGVDLFINARTDIYLHGLAQGQAAVAEVLRRARLYAEAGASGLFVPGVSVPAEIGALAKETSLPLNVMSIPGLPDAAALAQLGVRRVSSATGPAHVAWSALTLAAKAWLQGGDNDALAAAGSGAGSYGAYNGLFA
jgi:2-methylisocitrate lyase-like PEP mutase family enzyme